MTPSPEQTQEAGEQLVAPAYLSPSSIEAFRQCPLKFKYSRIDRLVDPPTEATTMGSFVHAVLEDLFRAPAADRTLPVAKTLMAEQWRNEWQEKAEEVLHNNENALHQFRWKSWWCVENYFGMEDPSSFDVSGIEHELLGPLGETTVSIRGFIDRWHHTDDGIVISDYKTGKTPQKRFQGDKFFQLLVYADMLASERNSPVSKIELLYLKDGVRLSRKVDVGEVEAMRETVVQVHRGIHERCAQGVFEPTPNRLCDWCSYKAICPAWN